MRNKYQVIMYGWIDDEVLSSAKGERQLAAWKASKETFKETLKDRSRAGTKHYVPVEKLPDQTPAGLAERKAAHQAKQAAQAEKIVLSSSDSPKEKAKRIKAVGDALTVWCATEKARLIDELEKEKRELESEPFADETNLRRIEAELRFLSRRGAVADHSEGRPRDDGGARRTRAAAHRCRARPERGERRRGGGERGDEAKKKLAANRRK